MLKRDGLQRISPLRGARLLRDKDLRTLLSTAQARLLTHTRLICRPNNPNAPNQQVTDHPAAASQKETAQRRSSPRKLPTVTSALKPGTTLAVAGSGTLPTTSSSKSDATLTRGTLTVQRKRRVTVLVPWLTRSLGASPPWHRVQAARPISRSRNTGTRRSHLRTWNGSSITSRKTRRCSPSQGNWTCSRLRRLNRQSIRCNRRISIILVLQTKAV